MGWQEMNEIAKMKIRCCCVQWFYIFSITLMFYLLFQLSLHTKQMFYWAVYSDSLLFFLSDDCEFSTVCEHLNLRYLAFINPEIQLFLFWLSAYL